MAKKTKATKAETKTETTTEPTTPAPVATTSEQPAAEPAAGEAKRQPKPATTKGSNIKASKSTVQNPVKVVYQLVAEMVAKDPNVRRKELVDAAIKAGCAY